MQLRLLRLCAAALVAGFLTLSPRASADTISGLSLTLNPSLPGNGNGVNGGGPFTWNVNSPLNTSFGSSITTYCADAFDGIRNGTFTASTDITTVSHITTANASAITNLFDRYYNSSLKSATFEAAFQLALWELIYDGVPSNPSTAFNGGTITAGSGTVTTDAINLLKGKYFDGSTYAGDHALANATLYGLAPSDNGTSGLKPNQAQLAVIPNPVKGVPAPPAVLLAGIGVLALFGRARWNRKKATPTA